MKDVKIFLSVLVIKSTHIYQNSPKKQLNVLFMDNFMIGDFPDTPCIATYWHPYTLSTAYHDVNLYL